MPKLIFDIETVGEDFDSLDQDTQKALTRWLKREIFSDEDYQAKMIEIKNGLGFSPLTGEIVALGVLDVESDKGVVYYQAPGEKTEETEKDGIKYKLTTEKEMLEKFWQGAAKYSEFISFNGRAFDVPYLMIRSAVHSIRPTKNLLSNRYVNSQRSDALHLDLIDQLSFYGAMQRKGSLHLYCRVFGIKSPKTEGITGDDVSKLFKNKEYKKIAEYNSWDLRATRELYEKWDKYLNI
ncbi:ribonuclease H-like domain-containing protein [Candidatus Falkowbacteria bacterium]|nr:ribonuclease H-like domain-containing protein [Candidatus Falkowbacteria bacterium]